MTAAVESFYVIRIQHAVDTGRYHAAYYRLAPFPGSVTSPARYKSVGHHTTGADTLESAQTHAAALAVELGVAVPAEGFSVEDIPEAGPDILVLPTKAVEG